MITFYRIYFKETVACIGAFPADTSDTEAMRYYVEDKIVFYCTDLCNLMTYGYRERFAYLFRDNVDSLSTKQNRSLFY